jgi:hypothetical protein
MIEERHGKAGLGGKGKKAIHKNAKFINERLY